MGGIGLRIGAVVAALLLAGWMAPAAVAGPASQPATPDLVGPPIAVASEAERVSRLQRGIDETSRRLAELRQSISSPQSDYARAQAEFQRLDAEHEAGKRELAQLSESGAPGLADKQKEFDALEQRWKLAKDRFDLAIAEHKTRQEQVATLETKLAQDRAALQKLLEPAPAATQPAVAVAVTTSAPAAGGVQPARPAVIPALAPLMPGGRASGAPAAPPAGESKRPPSAELAKAQVEAQRTEARAQQAEQALLSLTERIDAQRKSVELERRLVETARAKAQNAEATEKTLTAQRQRRTADGAPAGELGEISANIDAARQRGREARDEIARRIEGLEKLQSELARLQGEQIAQLQQAERERRAAVSAREQVEALENPLSPRNLYQWVIARGPRVLGIVVGVIAFLWLSRRIENRIIPLVAGRTEQGTLEERENRARTLVEVFHYVATVVLVSGGALMVLTELGVNIVPLMGGAAVIGLAVAFGAQNLIRDYFYGFMILLENQYAINDVVKIGSTSGMVEKITLRITVLRDLEGVVHFIPNGQIAQVSNLTHGWSRALFDIGVSYEEDVDRVMAVLTDLGRELRRDPEYRRLILDDPEMLGVEKFENSCVVIRFIMKTRPMHQWKVRREMLRRIKNRFDKEGIEIPYPQRTVHHRYPDASKAGTPPEFADGAD